MKKFVRVLLLCFIISSLCSTSVYATQIRAEDYIEDNSNVGVGIPVEDPVQNNPTQEQPIDYAPQVIDQGTPQMIDQNGAINTEGAPVPVADVSWDSKEMPVKSIVQDGALYVGLNHVKVVDNLSTAFQGYTQPAGEGYEFLVVFFEVYNNSTDLLNFNTEDVSVYVDSSQVTGFTSNYQMKEDGVVELVNTDLDSGRCLYYAKAYKIKKDWGKINIFYKEFNWVVEAGTIDATPFTKTSLYNAQVYDPMTVPGTQLYSDEYSVVYDGAQIIKPRSTAGIVRVIFLYTITNNSKKEITFSNLGYNMRGYQDNHLLNIASYVVTENFNGYSNIYKLKSLQKDMVAKVYVAFDMEEESGDLFMVYDAGYKTNHVIMGTAHTDYTKVVENKTYNDNQTVWAVQEALNELGYDCGRVDGFTGPNTEKGIMTYQAAVGLDPTGIIDDALLESLGIVIDWEIPEVTE